MNLPTVLRTMNCGFLFEFDYRNNPGARTSQSAIVNYWESGIDCHDPIGGRATFPKVPLLTCEWDCYLTYAQPFNLRKVSINLEVKLNT